MMTSSLWVDMSKSPLVFPCRSSNPDLVLLLAAIHFAYLASSLLPAEPASSFFKPLNYHFQQVFLPCIIFAFVKRI